MIHSLRGAAMTITSPVRMLGGAVAAPFNAIGNAIGNAGASSETLSELKKENERLTAKEYKEKDSYELSEFMSAHTITVGGVVVSDADKRRICDMATGLFWTRITATEKKN